MNPTGTTTLQIKRFIPASRARVYEAFTDAALIAKWMGPDEAQCVETKAEVKVGGRYAFRMKTCHPGGEGEVTVAGEYLEVVAPERLVFTWGWEGDPLEPSRVTVVLTELDGGTDVCLTHERLGNAVSRDQHAHGWTGSLDKLGRLCAPGASAASASATKPERPAVGVYGWNELMTTDVAGARAFYTGLFGWTAAAFPGNAEYTIFSAGSTMAAGMMSVVQPESPAYWLGYVLVENCDAAAAKAVELGGRVCMPTKEIPTVGRIAIITDPQGAALGLFEAGAK